jgi:hypothetical protein
MKQAIRSLPAALSDVKTKSWMYPCFYVSRTLAVLHGEGRKISFGEDVHMLSVRE